MLFERLMFASMIYLTTCRCSHYRLPSNITSKFLELYPLPKWRLVISLLKVMGGGGWSGGAKVLGKHSVPGRPTILNDSRARAYCACNRCGWGFVWTLFLSSIFSLFFLRLFGTRPDID